MTGKEPTIQEEMAKFQGFTSNNGATVHPEDKDTKVTATDVDLSEDERKAGVKIHGAEARQAPAKTADTKAAPVKVELTEDETTAALEKAGTDLGLKEGDELTDEEKAEALSAALKAKKETAKPGKTESDRVRRAQEGRRRAEARAARAEGQNADLARRIAALENGGGKVPLTGDTKDGKPDTKDKEPDPKEFEYGEVDPKYIRALARWETKQEIAEQTKSQQNKQHGSEQERAAAEFAEKRQALEDAGLDAYDDFHEVVLDTVNLPKSDPAAWPMSATVGQLVFESEVGAHIVYALASDPKEAKRVDKLTPAQQRLWFARQEAKFSSEQDASLKDGTDEQDDDTREAGETRKPQAQPRQVSKAPPPPRRNNGGSGNKQVSAATTDFQAFEAMANAVPARR